MIETLVNYLGYDFVRNALVAGTLAVGRLSCTAEPAGRRRGPGSDRRRLQEGGGQGGGAGEHGPVAGGQVEVADW